MTTVFSHLCHVTGSEPIREDYAVTNVNQLDRIRHTPPVGVSTSQFLKCENVKLNHVGVDTVKGAEFGT